MRRPGSKPEPIPLIGIDMDPRYYFESKKNTYEVRWHLIAWERQEVWVTDTSLEPEQRLQARQIFRVSINQAHNTAVSREYLKKVLASLQEIG